MKGSGPMGLDFANAISAHPRLEEYNRAAVKATVREWL